MRRDDGVWRRRDTRNRLYPVNRHGERITNPKTCIEGGSGQLDQSRLASLSPHYRWKVLNVAQRSQWRVENREKAAEAGDLDGSDVVAVIVGATPLFGKGEAGPNPWDDDIWYRWASILDMYADPTLILAECYGGEAAAANPAAPAEAGERGGLAPRMLKRHGPPRKHRQNNSGSGQRRTYHALVARPGGKAAIAKQPEVAQAMNHAWARLRSTYVWDEDNPRDSRGVRRAARDKRSDVHLGHLAGICVEKNSEMEVAHWKYKRTGPMPWKFRRGPVSRRGYIPGRGQYSSHIGGSESG